MSGLIRGGYAGPKEVHYLFIDGEQLQRTVEEVGQDWFGQAIDIDYRALQGSCQKVFYYDCPLAIRQGANEAEQQAKREA